MIRYNKLMDILSKRSLKKGNFADAIGIKTNTMNALSKNRNVNTSTIDKICEYLECQPGDIMEWVPDNGNQNADKSENLKLKKKIAELEAELKMLKS